MRDASTTYSLMSTLWLAVSRNLICVMLATTIEMENLPGSIPKILCSLSDLEALQALAEVENPEITIITVSFNLGRFLEDTIRSVANQTHRNFEHIVIDGGSTDQTVAILKKYPHIKWISEKDSGYPEAFRKGLAMARGKYVLQCAVSDGLANTHWLQYCADAMNADSEVSLVWGLPQYLTEAGAAGEVSFPQFHSVLAPRKKAFFAYWLRTGFFYPEGNLCVRKSVLETCYPQIGKEKPIIDWIEFSYNFNTFGYLSYFLPVVANFGRTHVGQMGQVWKKKGLLRKNRWNYWRIRLTYRLKLFLGLKNVVFVEGAGKRLIHEQRT